MTGDRQEQGEDPKVLAEIAKATRDLADFLAANQLEVDYCEADWRDTEGLIEEAHKLILKHPGWSLYYIGGDRFGIDSNYVFFTSKPVSDDLVETIGNLIVNEGAELPEEVAPPKPKCPKCEAEISRLDYHETKDYDSEVDLVDGRLVYSHEAIDVGERGFACPECGKDICKDDEAAINFLKGV